MLTWCRLSSASVCLDSNKGEHLIAFSTWITLTGEALDATRLAICRSDGGAHILSLPFNFCASPLHPTILWSDLLAALSRCQPRDNIPQFAVELTVQVFLQIPAVTAVALWNSPLRHPLALLSISIAIIENSLSQILFLLVEIVIKTPFLTLRCSPSAGKNSWIWVSMPVVFSSYGFTHEFIKVCFHFCITYIIQEALIYWLFSDLVGLQIAVFQVRILSSSCLQVFSGLLAQLGYGVLDSELVLGMVCQHNE